MAESHGGVGMIAWVNKTTDDSTVLLLFRRNQHTLKPVATMTEVGDNWEIQIGDEKKTIISGSGCPDPIEFLMTLTSPRNTTQNTSDPLMQYNRGNEKWEVWEVK
jgi:hypothetical protein